MTSSSLVKTSVIDRVKTKVSRFLGPWGVFFKGFIKHPVMVGSIIPSSSRTIRKMLAPVDWDNTKLFVEYGPGVGTFCQPVLDRLKPDARLIVIDLNPDFIEYLNRTFHDSRFIAVHGSAANVNEIIADFGFRNADYVLSGLPFSKQRRVLSVRVERFLFTSSAPAPAILWNRISPRSIMALKRGISCLVFCSGVGNPRVSE
jgi:phosphatidylethanolamine/phosphatidyl-N-methylethanolamine N-methyltransferase